MKVLVTGSSGLIGSEAVVFFHDLGFPVVGVDNNLRADFFGPRGDTSWNRDRLQKRCAGFEHVSADIRNREAMDSLLEERGFDLIVHAAAQPSHDLAASRPFDDFDVNAGGTLNLLESCRRHSPQAVFIFMSTNKVYGDGPNHVPLVEQETRYDYADPAYEHGIAETFPVDHCLHSLFGASKLAADVIAQEYGRYFGMNVGVFRGGCLTGPHHSGVELHGFLSHLVNTIVSEREYTVFGYGGKQVRDQIHSFDVINAFWHFAQNPRPGAVYNLGGGKANAASLLECVRMVEERAGKSARLKMGGAARKGDHICYYSDMRKFERDYPDWRLRHSLAEIVDEMVEQARSAVAATA